MEILEGAIKLSIVSEAAAFKKFQTYKANFKHVIAICKTNVIEGISFLRVVLIS